MRSQADRRARPWQICGMLLALGAWAGWLGFAKVDVYATSAQARLEVERLPSRVSAPEAGRIAGLNVALGRHVDEGDVLVQLDTNVEQRRVDEELAHATSTEPKLAATRAQLAVASDVRRERWRLNGVSTSRAKVEQDEAEAQRVHQEKLGVMNQNLSDNQLLSKSDKVKADGELEESRLKARGARVEVSRLGATRTFEDKQEAAHIAELSRQLSDLEAERAAALAALDTARAQLERRTVRAAATGRLGSIAALAIGDVVKAGDVIATIIPVSDVHVVAEYTPSGAVGRVLPGQNARVRLDGFSWTEYGMLEARVVDVANEPANGTVRVELVIAAERAPKVPIQHGIAATVDVRVEQASPLALLLRGVGSRVAPPAVPAAPGSGVVVASDRVAPQ